MQFLDEIHLQLIAGSGGKGCVSFLREKYKPKGGPDGGDGGKGGSIYIQVDRSLQSLSHLSRAKIYKAEDGKAGQGKKKAGKQGKDIHIYVPLGTQIFNATSTKNIEDLCKKEQRMLIALGGKGGLGNHHFASAARQMPVYAQQGLPGTSIKVILRLKLLADVGLVGLPNAGKSTLLNSITNKKSKIGNYAFTTLTPQIGLVESNKEDIKTLAAGYRRFYLADIPGIIEGASKGSGLGLVFLRHIERVSVIAYLLDLESNDSTEEQLEILQKELSDYKSELLKKAHIFIFNKIDSLNYDTKLLEKHKQEFMKKLNIQNPNHIIYISAKEKNNLEKLKKTIFEVVPMPSFAEEVL